LCAHSALQPGAGPAVVEALLQQECERLGQDDHLVLVSHQPLVSRLVEHYLGQSGQVPSLSPGGLATLALETASVGGARLLFWALPPEYEASI
jgi:phosphohistidine phosphatase